ncbi:MAG: prepilin peptidase [Persephonella sp.]|nr:MAG: prepilin peptidase [Persephonella sp.]
MQDINFLFLIFAFIFGSIIGSFLNVLIYRLPLPREEKRSIFNPPYSICPNCEARIKAYDNIPILSYFLLKGRCRNCKSKISLQYPIVEILTGFASVLAYLKVSKYLFINNQINKMALIDYFFIFSFLALMIALSFIDLEHKIIPNEINVIGFLLGIIYTYFRPDMTLLDALAGSIVGGGLLFAIAFFYEKVKNIDALGMGDVKLLVFIGSFVGVFGAIFTIFIGSLLALIVAFAGYAVNSNKNIREYEIAFGPYLAIAGSIYILIGDKIKAFYFGGL